MKKISKKWYVIGGIVVAAILFKLFVGGGEVVSPYETATAEVSDLVQEISATGRVEALESVDLAFERGGRVNGVYVEVGDTVVKGMRLVQLESSEVLAELAQARAAVESAEASLAQFEAALTNQEAKLAEMRAGTRPEEIEFYESKVANAQISLTAARENMIDVMRDGYTRAEDAVKSKADALFNNPTTNDVALKFSSSDSSLRQELNTSRVVLGGMFTSWKSTLDALSGESELDTDIAASKANLESVKVFLEKISTALNSALTNSTITETIVDGWKTDISAARTSVNTAIAGHSTAKEKLKTAESALNISRNELALRKAGSTAEQIVAQEAAVAQARANIVSQEAQIRVSDSALEAVRAKLVKNTLYAPFAGVVTEQNAKVGAIVAANQSVVSIITEGEYEIVAQIVEADIAGLEVGDRASLTLDAYGDDVVFYATVVDIEPAADLIEGVANYKTTLAFDEADERVRAGMTADLDIVIAEREGVVSIPQRAVIFKGNKKIVRVLEGEEVREVEVTTGITGARGMIEVTSGINEGDVVITATKK